MTLDGSSANRKAYGRLIRNASQDFAVAQYPLLVVEIALGSIRRNTIILNSINGREIVSIYVAQKPELQMTITKADFDICKNLANNNIIGRLFPHDKKEDLVARARGMVREAFKDRA
jgi:hypothetical protein